jgi:hypothetical protein
MTHLVHSELGISSENVVFVCLMLAVFYIVGSFTAILLFQRYSRDKYGYMFFGIKKCYWAAFGLLSMIMACVIAHNGSVGKPTGDLGSGPALLIGSFLLGALAFEDVRKTNLMMGLSGFVVQVVTAPLLAVVALVALSLCFIVGAAAAATVVPVIDIGDLGEGFVAKVKRR